MRRAAASRYSLTIDERSSAPRSERTALEHRRNRTRHDRPDPRLLGDGAKLGRLEGPHVNYKNPDRAPLLFISGGEDHLMPPSIQRSNAKHYKAEGTITEVVEYEGRAHLMPAQAGWEEVADYALSWATEQAAVWASRRPLEARA
jgi:pimeloyl-ACP methyl ester carboxylesterase